MEESRSILSLPVGFKFRPSDENLVECCLFNKITGNPIPFVDQIIRDHNLYGTEEPWQIWELFGGPELEDGEDLYFFTQLKKRGSRIDRKVGSGAWEGEDSAEEIISRKSNTVVGSKKRFRYEKKKPPCEQHGCWIMHEYSLNSCLLPQIQNQNQQNQYVLCRIRKNDETAKAGKKCPRKKRKFEEQVKSNMEVAEEDPHQQYKRQKLPSNLQKNQLPVTQQSTTTTHDQIETQQCLLRNPSGFEENQQLFITEQQSVHLTEELSENNCFHTSYGFQVNQEVPITEQQSLLHQPREFSEDNCLHTSHGFQVNQEVPITEQQSPLHQPRELSENDRHTPSDLKLNQQLHASIDGDNDDIFSGIYFSDAKILSLDLPSTSVTLKQLPASTYFFDDKFQTGLSLELPSTSAPALHESFDFFEGFCDWRYSDD